MVPMGSPVAGTRTLKRRLLLMCMAVTRRGQGAVQGALSIVSQYPLQRVP
jgi:hypothetical protein